MKKIISILVALGLVLGLFVMTTPVAADIDNVSVSVTSTACAGDEGVYTINFDIEASLTEGVGCVCIKFPDDTGVPASFETGDITFEGANVFEEEITVTGREVCFIPPRDNIGLTITVVFTADADIVNPSEAGEYTLEVRTCRAPDSEYVESDPYTILPAVSEYGITVDFSVTYPGLAKDFVPPFKMCGQNDTYQFWEDPDWQFDTVYNDTIPGWLTVFNLTFAEILEGCRAACENATIWFELVKCPEDEVITLGLNGTWYTLTSANLTDTVCEFDSDTDWVVANVSLTVGMAPVTWNASLHFSSPGKYEICFKAECPTAPVCQEPGTEIIAKRCLPISVYQWKEAFYIPLYHKWNLISLPLVPLVDPPIGDILAAYPFQDDIISIWYYDRCEGDEGTWYVYPTPGADQQALTTMEDGKAYWIRIAYNSTPGYQMGDPAGGLWVWGTVKPVPPAAPSAYPVCEGWNMMGFTNNWADWDDVYLWNWTPLSGYGAVYGWWGPGQNWWLASVHSIQMWPGEGFWTSFAADGMIYPP